MEILIPGILCILLLLILWSMERSGMIGIAIRVYKMMFKQLFQ